MRTFDRTKTSTKTSTRLATLVIALAAGIGTTATAQSFTPPVVATSSSTMPYSDLVQSQALATNSTGDIFFSRPASGILAKKPASGGTEVTLYTLPSGGGGYPKGVAANDTYAYITDYAGHLWQVPVNGGAATDILTACGSIDNGYLGTQDVAVDGLGNVFVAGNNESTLFKITTAGACSTVSGVTLDANSHVSADTAGNLSYSTNGVLYSLSAGASSSIVVPGTFNSIVGLRADSAGNVFVTTYSGIVEVPFVNGALDGSKAFTVLTRSSQNDVAVAPNGVLYTTDGSNIFRNLLGAVRFSTVAAGIESPTQTVTAIFNSSQVLSGIRYAVGTAASTEIVNDGAGTCAISQSYDAGASCTLSLTFTPKTLGARNGSVVLSSSAGVIGSVAVAGQGSGAGLVVDPGTQSSLGSGWQSPAGVSVGLAGDVLVADKTAGTLSYFAANSSTGTVIASGLTKPGAVAEAADGTAYVATAAGTIVQVPYAGTAYGVSTTIATGLKSPAGLAIGPNGSLYVANTGAGTVVEYASQSGSLNFAVPVSIGTGFKAPIGLAFDAAGDLFVADSSAGSIFKVAGTKADAVVTGLTSPTALAIDDAGSLYVLQSGAATVLRIPYTDGSYGSNSTTTLGLGLTTVSSFAADSTGSLYVADAGAPAVIQILRSAGSLNLGKINVGASSTQQSLSLSNNGDQALALSSPFFTASGDTADFTISTSGSNACSSGGTLLTGETCAIAGTFIPTAQGPLAETLTFSSNAVNANPITGAFTGTGINLPKTTLTLTTSPTGTVTYGTSVTATAIVAAQAGSAGSTTTPTGTVTFLVNGLVYKVVTIASGKAFATITGLPAGSNTLDASYSGDDNFAASSGATQTIAVTLAPTATSFTSSIAATKPVPPGTSVTLTARVSSSIIGAQPTGTVTFVSNGVTLASANVDASTGIAAVTTTTLPSGNYTIAAVYSGDSGFAASSSAAISVSIRTQQFDITDTPTTLSVSAPGSVSTTFSIVPISGYVGGLDLACSGLPANTQCAFVPGTVAFISGGPAQNVKLTITTNTPPPTTVAAWILPFGMILLIGMWRKHKTLSTLRYAMVIAVLITYGTALISLSGCGAQSNKTPKGASNVTVTLTAAPNGTTTVPPNGTGNIVKTFSFTLNVQ